MEMVVLEENLNVIYCNIQLVIYLTPNMGILCAMFYFSLLGPSKDGLYLRSGQL